jgi:hypothetical protein
MSDTESYRAAPRWRGTIDLGLLLALIFGIMNMESDKRKELARLRSGTQAVADTESLLRQNVYIGVAIT